MTARRLSRMRLRRRQNEMDASSSTIPITVRQLEAVVRVSEALAKLQLSHEVTPDHVKEAVRLFKATGSLTARRLGCSSLSLSLSLSLSMYYTYVYNICTSRYI